MISSIVGPGGDDGFAPRALRSSGGCGEISARRSRTALVTGTKGQGSCSKPAPDATICRHDDQR
jgi:hypothetical protein